MNALSKPRWTTQQEHCIVARGGTVLVSAAAGSGKTAVLIERIVSLLCDPDHPMDIEKLLVVTFTKAAAAEMRSRLNRRLAEELSVDPHNRHLLRQQMMLPQAMICTIDSFCIQLLREYAAQANVSPRFRIADETALNLLMHDTAHEVINEAHKCGDVGFMRLCDTLTDDRSDEQLTAELLRTYNFIQAHPFPLRWLDHQQQRFRESGDIAHTIWGQLLIQDAKEALTSAAVTLSCALDEMSHDDAITAAYGPSISAILDSVTQTLHSFDGNWDTVRHAVRTIRIPGFGSLSKDYDNVTFKKHITAMRDHAKKLIAHAAEDCLGRSQQQALEDIADAADQVEALFDLVRTFTDHFSKAKAEQNMLDFNDCEHRLLSLLATPNDDGSFTRTQAAKEIGSRFSHIMVDEYQDTNATQDTLFSALSDNEQNLFFVGDLKQSIYGFRQAMPSIFQNRRRNSTPYNGTDYPAAITLGNNFRSRSQVAQSTNFVFRRIMTEPVGGIVYDENEELVASAVFPQADDPAYDTEMIITERTAHPKGLSRHQAEARLVGERIHEMMAEGFQVTDKSGMRPVEYRDFCILMRGTDKKAPVFIKELQAMGIPVAAETRENIFAFAEIKMIMAILRTIDNPLLDVPLLATLMSPVFAFTPDEIADIRAVDHHASLYTALRKLSRKSTPTAKRCKDFLDRLSHYRVLAAAMPVDRLIRRFYEDNDLLPIMSAKNGGTARIANLRKFYDQARRFEDRDFRGLSAFIRHMTRLEEKSIAIKAASVSETQNAVKLMTIHHSKGLEFPVVFLAEIGSDIVRNSVYNDILLHAEHGIGMICRNRETMTENNTLHRQALKAAIKQSELAEELRVLYVAMTRAKDKLILLTTVKNLASKIENLHVTACKAGETLMPYFIKNAVSVSDWVLASILQHETGIMLERVRNGEAPYDIHENGLKITVRKPTDDPQAWEHIASDEDTPSLDHIEPRLHYSYPYVALGQIAAKITASQTSHHAADEGIPLLTQPAFLSKGGLTPAQRGTATHLFLEHLDLSAEDAAAQAETMVERGILTKQQKDALNLQHLQRFLQSDTAARMAASPLLLREFPFTVERPVSDFGLDTSALPHDAATETILVQGIADAVFEEDGQLVIVDYKTDRIQNGQELIDRYHSQLEIYKEALTRTLQRPVKECLLYSFCLDETVRL